MKKLYARDGCTKRIQYHVDQDTSDLIDTLSDQYIKRVGVKVSRSLLMARAVQIMAVYLPTVPATIEMAQLDRLIQ